MKFEIELNAGDERFHSLTEFLNSNKIDYSHPHVLLQHDVIRCAADLIPTSWLDPLLTGDKQVIAAPPYYCPDIERLLRAIKERIVEHETHGV